MEIEDTPILKAKAMCSRKKTAIAYIFVVLIKFPFLYCQLPIFSYHNWCHDIAEQVLSWF
jgi:hypothetical protein